MLKTIKKVDANGRLTKEASEKIAVQGLTLYNYGRVKSKKYDALIAKDVFRFLVQYQDFECDADSVCNDEIDYSTLEDEGVDPTDLKAVIQFVVDRGESMDIEEGRTIQDLIDDFSDNDIIDLK